MWQEIAAPGPRAHTAPIATAETLRSLLRQAGMRRDITAGRTAVGLFLRFDRAPDPMSSQEGVDLHHLKLFTDCHGGLRLSTPVQI